MKTTKITFDDDELNYFVEARMYYQCSPVGATANRKITWKRKNEKLINDYNNENDERSAKHKARSSSNYIVRSIIMMRSN